MLKTLLPPIHTPALPGFLTSAQNLKVNIEWPAARSRVKRADDIKRLEEATEKQDYKYWLSQEDIADIARLEYGSYKRLSFKFEIVGNVGGHLTRQIEEFKAQASQQNKARWLTLIINLNNLHWVTLVISYENSQFSAYYIDSLGKGIPGDLQKVIQQVQLVALMSGKIQQADGYNCALWALENAADINGMLDQKKPLDWLVSQLERPRNEGYFEERRRLFSEKLRVDIERRERRVATHSESFEARKVLDKVLSATQRESVVHDIHTKTKSSDQQSPSGSRQELKSSRRRSSDSSDYEDKPITPEEELVNTIRSSDSQEEKLIKIEKLIAKGADINFKDTNRNNDTPLHIAVRKKELKVIALLVVEKGADIAIKNDRNRTPLEIAKRLNRPDIIHILETALNPKPQSPIELLSKQFEHKADQPEQSQPRNKNANVDNQNIQRRQGDPVHGNIYQLKLLMLFLYRGVSHQYAFHLGTEIKEAKKFDDLVFEYTNKAGKKEYRLLQAKHKLDESIKIRSDHLLTESDGDYSLVKYFFSYQDAKKEKLFKDGVIKDVIICTNIDLDFDELQSKKINVEKLKDSDDILDVKSKDDKEAIRYRFNEEVTSSLNPKLQNYNLTRLARRLAECLLKNNLIEDRDEDIFKFYHVALAEEVIDVKTKKFSDNFIRGEAISEAAKKFREAFKGEIKKQSKGKLTLETINEAISNKEIIINNKQVRLNLSENFGRGEDKIWSAISDDEIKDFLNHLVFAVNQPNEEELGKIVKAEIGKEFGFITTEYAYNQFFITMLNWLQGKEGGRFFSYEEGKELFEAVKQKISSLGLISSTLLYKDIFEKYRLKFKEDVEVVQEIKKFLNYQDNADQLQSNKKQILTIYQKNRFLSGIKVYQVLASHDRKVDQDIFLDLKSLSLLVGSTADPIKAFRLNEKGCLIIAHNSVLDEDAKKLLKSLYEVLVQNPDKKIILITPQAKKENTEKVLNNLFSELSIDKNEKCIDVADDNNNFNALNFESQKTLEKEGNVIFQGKEVSLGELIDEQSKYLIDGEVLSKLINNEEIRIGSELERFSDMEAAYAKFQEDISVSNLVEALSKNLDQPDSLPSLFIISGIDPSGSETMEGKLIQHLELGEEDANAIKNQIGLFDKDIVGNKRILIARLELQEANFKKFCRNHNNPKQMIYLIHWEGGKFVWQQLYDPNFYIDRIFNYQDKIVIKNDITEEHLVLEVGYVDLFVFGNLEDESKKAVVTKQLKDALQPFIPNIVDIINKESRRVTVPMKAEDTEAFFNSLDQKTEPVHWLKKVEGEKQLTWYRSEGPLDGLEKYIDKRKRERKQLTEEQFIEKLSKKAAIIIDEPGMGKTTALTKLSEYKLESNWVIRINFRNCEDAIQRLPSDFKKVTIAKAVEFLSQTDSLLSSDLAKGLIQHKLEHATNNRPLLLLLDGFDEIKGTNREGKEKVSSLLKFLKGKATVWVTARKHEREILQNSLSVFNTQFKKLDLKNQKKFLRKFWKARFSLTLSQNELAEVFGPKSRFEEYSTKLLEKVGEVLREENATFIGIALQLRLLAEGFQNGFREFITSKNDQALNFENFNILSIYQNFINSKYNIYFKEKTGLFAGFSDVSKDWFIELLIKRHKRLALKEIFGDKAKEFIEEKSPFLKGDEESQLKLDNKSLEELCRVGLIQSVQDKRFEFIHRTFAEYFSAVFFVGMLKKLEKNQKFQLIRDFLREHIFEEENKVIRNFFDRMLAKDEQSENKYEVHVAALNNDNNKIEKLLLDAQIAGNIINNPDKAGRTALHLAAAYGYASIARSLLEKDNVDIRRTDNIFNWTPLHYAIRIEKKIINDVRFESSFDFDRDRHPIYKKIVLDLFLESEQHKSTVLSILRAKDYDALKLAAQWGRSEVLNWLWDNSNEEQKQDISRVLSEKNYLIFIEAVRRGIIKTLDWFWHDEYEDGNKVGSTQKKEDILKALSTDSDAANRIWSSYDEYFDSRMDDDNLFGWFWWHVDRLNNPKMYSTLMSNMLEKLHSDYHDTAFRYAVNHVRKDVLNWLWGHADSNEKRKAMLSTGNYYAFSPVVGSNKGWKKKKEILNWLWDHAEEIDVGSNEVRKAMLRAGDYEAFKSVAGSYENWGKKKEILDWFWKQAKEIDVGSNKVRKAMLSAGEYGAFRSSLILKDFLDYREIKITGLDSLDWFWSCADECGKQKEMLSSKKYEAFIAMCTIDIPASYRKLQSKKQEDVLDWFWTKADDNARIAMLSSAQDKGLFASIGNLDVVKFLVGKGANVNMAGNNGVLPLHYAAANGHTEVVKFLLVSGANINARNKWKRTALHRAAKNGHESTVKVLLENKKADVNAVDNEGKTPLDYAPDKKHQEVVKFLKQEGAKTGEQLGILASQVEGCLLGPSTSSGNRQKREAINECEITWEDVDEFNEEKEHPREFAKIKINGEQFLRHLKDNPPFTETKRTQLLDLAAKVPVTGVFKDRVSGLVNQKTLKYLQKVGHISGMVMYGMMSKNTLRDLFKGDYEGVAINLGFIALPLGVRVGEDLARKGIQSASEAAYARGFKLAPAIELSLAESLRISSPFLARGTSGFIIYDLVNQIKAYKKGNPDAVVGIAEDSIYLGVDAAEIGVEIAEIGGLLEGVSSVTGPIGATIGAVIFVGTDVYLAIRQVDRLDTLIHITTKERFIEGLRAFIGKEPRQYLNTLLEEKQLNNELAKQRLAYLKAHPTIQRYVFPTEKSVIDACATETIKKEICERGGIINGRCVIGTGVYIKEIREKCTTKVQIDLDNAVLLDSKRENIHWSRAKPDDLSEGSLFCLPTGDGDKVPSGGAYLCENAMGIEYSHNRTGHDILISLGDGNDTVVGFSNGTHRVVLGDGYKNITLGEGDDTFLLNGNYTMGSLTGGQGINTLDLGFFGNSRELMSLFVLTGRLIYPQQENQSYDYLSIEGIQNFLLRSDKQDYIMPACDTRYIDTRGGEGQDKLDIIRIVNNQDALGSALGSALAANCDYNLTLIIRPYSDIGNSAREGHFTYLIPVANKGESTVKLLTTNSSHHFAFAYTLYDIHWLKKVNDTVSVGFIKNIGGMQFLPKVINSNTGYTLDNEFTLHISKVTPNDILYTLSDQTEIKVGEKNVYAMQHTNRSVEDIVQDYPAIANRLNMSIFVHCLLGNETIGIGHGKHDVLSNNPYRRSHLVGNGGENIFIVTSGYKVLDKGKLPLPEVILYDVDNENLTDTLDLREIKKQFEKDIGLKVQAKTSLLANDLLIELFLTNSSESVVTVRLKDALLTNWHKRLHIILNHAPMELDALDLKPLPLEFTQDKNIIVIGSDDVEGGTKLVIPKKSGHYRFARVENNLVMSNGFDCNITTTECYALSLQGFYQAPKLATLSIKFADKEIVLKEEMEKISNATMLDTQIMHYNQAKESLFFNTTTAPHSRGRREVKGPNEGLNNAFKENSASSPATSASSRINHLASWIKEKSGTLVSTIFNGFDSGTAKASECFYEPPTLESSSNQSHSEKNKHFEVAYNGNMADNVYLVKWLFGRFGIHSIVNRMNKAEQALANNHDSMSPLDWREKQLKIGIDTYGSKKEKATFNAFQEKRTTTSKSEATFAEKWTDSKNMTSGFFRLPAPPLSVANDSSFGHTRIKGGN